VFVGPALTIDMYATDASCVADRKSMMIIPGDIDVTGIEHSTVAVEPPFWPDIEQVTVELAPFAAGNVTVGDRVEPPTTPHVPGIAK
jgi:hypothetical protein